MANGLLNSDNLRTTWKVKTAAANVYVAAQEKLAYHQGRLQVWEAARDETINKIKSNGVVIDESVLNDMGSSTYSNSGRQPGVSVNTELVRDLNEANQKITEHKDKVRAFDSWVQFLSSATGDLELTLSDYLYFFGK
jgi:hypothetical protein